MRTTHICPKCGHNRILHIANVPDRTSEGIRKLDVACIPNPNYGLGQDEHQTAGHLHACVCRQCGFAELYVKDPGSIPIDGDYVKELVGKEPEGPYR